MKDEMNYKPNSHKSKAEVSEVPKKKVEKIVKGTARVKKKNGFTKALSSFVAEDAENIKSYIISDVLIPTIKNAISDTIDMFLFGEHGRRRKSSTSSKISYRDYYERKDDRSNSRTTLIRSGYSYDEIILDSRGEAEDVLTRMDELLENYGMVSVADLYDLVGVSGNYTDNNYGWFNINNAEVVRVSDGYLLKLPKVVSL